MDAIKTKDAIVEWIRNYFKNNGPGCSAIVGLSGGKDSSIVAALCVEALGKDRVIGVIMPNGIMSGEDIDACYTLLDYLEIEHLIINIGETVKTFSVELSWRMRMFDIPQNTSNQAAINLPARIRMAALYAVAQSINGGGRVANTCNLSENYVGYSTKYGDAAGDFSPLENLTVGEVKQIGYALDLPVELVDKIPSDGLCGKSDEDNLGFTYEVLDNYILTGICDDIDVKARIDYLHERNLHKLSAMPSFGRAEIK